MIVEQTNHAANQENISTTFKTDSDQIRQYIGILILYVRLPLPKFGELLGKKRVSSNTKNHACKKVHGN